MSTLKQEYAELRRDPRWQKRRLEIMQRDGFACIVCEDRLSTLNVHHAYYVKGRMPWDYPDFALSTLCEECHKERHSRVESDHPLEEWERVMDWLCGGDPDFIGGPLWTLAVSIDEGVTAERISRPGIIIELTRIVRETIQ